MGKIATLEVIILHQHGRGFQKPLILSYGGGSTQSNPPLMGYKILFWSDIQIEFHAKSANTPKATKNKCLGSHQKKKKKNDEGERKYHIIRKIDTFHVFPKTEYLTRSVALFLL